jgi:hypothetical protein
MQAPELIRVEESPAQAPISSLGSAKVAHEEPRSESGVTQLRK